MDLRRFLGSVNFYRRHIKNAAANQALLHELLHGAKKQDMSPIAWNEQSTAAFLQCKQDIANAALSAHPHAGAKLRICADASGTAMGASLEQLVDNARQPLAFFPKTFTPAEKRYSSYNRELTALFSAVKFFRGLIEGSELIPVTDQKLLTYAFKQKMDKASPRQARQLGLISKYSTEIQHIKGENNVVADDLSRIEAIRMPTVINLAALVEAQSSDEELAALMKDPNSSLAFRKLTHGQDNAGIFCDVSTTDIRPFVPAAFRRQIFDTFHGQSHPSARATVKLVCQRYVWPSMNSVTQWTRAC